MTKEQVEQFEKMANDFGWTEEVKNRVCGFIVSCTETAYKDGQDTMEESMAISYGSWNEP